MLALENVLRQGTAGDHHFLNDNQKVSGCRATPAALKLENIQASYDDMDGGEYVVIETPLNDGGGRLLVIQTTGYFAHGGLHCLRGCDEGLNVVR